MERENKSDVRFNCSSGTESGNFPCDFVIIGTSIQEILRENVDASSDD